MYSYTRSLTSALGGGEWSASCPGRFTPRERSPGTYWIGGCVGPRDVLDAVVKRKISSPRRESNPRTPIVQHYTNWAITALSYFSLVRSILIVSSHPRPVAIHQPASSVIGYGMATGFRRPVGAEVASESRPALGPSQPCTQLVLGTLFLVLRLRDHEMCGFLTPRPHTLQFCGEWIDNTASREGDRTRDSERIDARGARSAACGVATEAPSVAALGCRRAGVWTASGRLELSTGDHGSVA
jgi:hypothetical protein